VPALTLIAKTSKVEEKRRAVVVSRNAGSAGHAMSREGFYAA
jgi:hypothetical protein